eukprot:symbB.v1.2.037085.t1/scaffold5381.1/size27835/3
MPRNTVDVENLSLRQISDELLPRDAAQIQAVAAEALSRGQRALHITQDFAREHYKDEAALSQLYEVVDRLRIAAKDVQNYIDRSLLLTHGFVPIIESTYPCHGGNKAVSLAHSLHLGLGRETQGPMPVEAPTTLASGSMDSFQHVEAVLKDDNVSTSTLDSQDWEMVTEMVEDTDNAATHFLQGKHVIDLEGPAPNLQDSIDTMMATMEKMRGTSSTTFILAEVPFSMEAVTKDVKLMVDKLSTEEIFDLFVKFCDSESIPAVSFGRVVKAYVAMKAQKVHDEEKMCICGKKVLPMKKTKHLVNMDHPTGNWLLFMTGNGITWVRDGKSEADAASASGDVSSKSDKDFKLRHAVDIGMLALCPADHAETSLSDFVQSKDRLQLRTEVLNRVVDAETFPSEAPSRPQNSKDCKKEQAALVFHPDAAAAMALAGKLTGADVPPEEAFHPKRPEAEMLKVVQDNADILHDMQSGAMSVEDPQGAEALRHLDMVKFKEVLKRKFLEGPGSNQSAWEALNRSMVELDTAKAKNREYEQATRAYKQFLTPPPGTPSIWGEELQQLIEAGCFCPLTGMRKPSPELDQSNAIGEYVKAKHMIAELRQQAYPGKLLTEVPQCQLDMHVATAVPDKSFPMEAKRLEPGSPEAKVALLHHMINMCDGEIRLHAGRWRRYESTDVPTWSKLPQPTWEAAQALERRTHPRDQGSNFVDTDEELEDHRRLGLRPYWSYLKGSFFAYEPAPADGGAQDRIVERKKIQKETMDFLEQMQLPKPTSVEEWRLIWREVGTLLAAKHFISHTPVPVMDLPVADVVDSKEQLRFRAMCDERISFPFEELRPFEEVYAKLEPYVQSSSYVEVKFKFPSPFARAYLHSPQLVQEALEALNIGPFQADGEFLCMRFLQPKDEPPSADGVGSRPWDAFRRVLEDLGEHTDQTQSVIPSEQWKQWFLGLDERVPFSPSDAFDLERSLWLIMEKVSCGKPSYTFTPRECGWEHHDREVWQSRHRPPPITQLQLAKWRHWRPAQLRDLEPTTQRALEEKLRQHWSNRLISHLAPHASDIPAMAAVMGDRNDHEEFLHLLGDARFSTLRQRCLALEKLKKHGGLQIPWTEKSVRSLLSNDHKEECIPNYIQQAWDTLKWFSTKFQTLDVTATHRLASKKKWLQETLVSTAATPQRKAVVPAKEVILALEHGAAAGGADPRRKGQVAREAIDAFILGMVRFQVGSSARFNDLQHTSPSTMKITSNTIEMMAWQTKTASAFRIKKNPVPKLSLSGVDWWTEWSKTLTLLSSLERFQDMDYLIPTLSKDFQGVIPRPSTSDRGLRWLKEALVRQGVDQDLVTPLTWHSFRVFIPDWDTESLNDSNGSELVQSDAETGLIESEGNFVDRDGRAVCGWSPDLTKVSSMTKDDYDTEAADLFHCTIDVSIGGLGQRHPAVLGSGDPCPSAVGRMAAAPDLSKIPPAEIPDALQDGIAKLSAPLQQLLMGKSVPYLIQHRLGSENYVTVEDLADRWDSAQVARQQGPRELGFEANHNGFTAASSGFAAMKLFQVVRAAKEMIQTHPAVLATPGPGPSRPLSLSEVLCERPQLEKEFAAKWGIPKPQYRDQGSDALLRLLQQRRDWFHIHSKYIISALPEEGERPIKTRKKITVDGWEKEEEEEERAAPTTRRQLERLHLIFRNTLLMCLAAFPQFPQFNLTKEDLDSFYDWFYGPELGGRRPSPPEQTLLMAERNAWREVHELMHGGMYLKEALDKVQNNSLFWMREVYERVISERAKGKSKKGKDKKGSWAYPIRQPQWEKKGKGYGDKGGKGKGKAKSKPSDWPSNWAFKNPKGVPFCRDYFIKKTCQGQCGRSHNCPVVNSEGWVCNAGRKEHKPEHCPHKA